MSLRSSMLRIYWAMERLLVPGLQYSQHHYEACLRKWIAPGTRWLDVGCGRRLLPEWRTQSERELQQRATHLVGIDLDMDSLRSNGVVRDKVFGSADRLPFPPGTFDVVTANMVLEHLSDPLAVFLEVRRVLVPGGLFILHTPNVQAFPTALAKHVPESLKKLLAALLDGRKTPTCSRLTTWLTHPNNFRHWRSGSAS